ncbi:MAG: FAD-dependent oxidoreductase [Acuticoccus sp.]
MLEPDICVIGGGSAGLTVAAAAASFGQGVVLVERGRMGGDCLNYGCVPSKSLIAAARHAHQGGAPFGVTGQADVDFKAVHDHVHGVITAIAPHDSVERFEGLGVTVLEAEARFVDETTIVAGQTRVRPRRFVIATGSRPVLPPIPGLADAAPLTNESVFDLTRLPQRLVVIGAGPIGAELGQAFARLGSTVTLVSAEPLLAREDPDAAAVVRRHLAADGVTLIEGAAIESVQRADGTVTLALKDGGTVTGDNLLVAAGRAPNTENLDLAAAGIATEHGAITVDDRLRTTNRRAYAIGDVNGGLQFTHVAGHQASLVVRAIVFRLPARYDADLMPHAIYTAPEIAAVGLGEADARARYGHRASVSTAPLAGNDRARTDAETDGFVKLVLGPGGKLVGATIVAPHAGEMIATYALALAGKVSLKTVASFTPAYPTYSEAGKRAAVSHFAKKLDSPWLRRILALLKRLP